MDTLNPAEWVTIRRADLDALRARADAPVPANGHLLRVSQVAERLSLSRSEAYRLVAAGDLASVTIRRAIRVKPEDLQAFIDQRRSQ